MRFLAILALAGALAGPVAAQTTDPMQLPAGTYRTDPSHTALIFRVNHLGFSNYTAFFTDVEATLTFDPAAPETMTLETRIDAASIGTLHADPVFDFNALIAGPEFLDAAQFPEITFSSTKIALTGPASADVTGDLTLHGVTRPVTLATTFNGGYPGHPLDPGGARIGFSATGTLNRSDFGIGFGIPAPGTTLGVSDEVEIIVETELLNPDAPKP